MAEWQVETPSIAAQKEQERRELLGDEAYEERIQVANEKAAELKWDEEMFFKPQFVEMAFAASDKLWPQLKEKPGLFWKILFASIANK